MIAAIVAVVLVLVLKKDGGSSDPPLPPFAKLNPYNGKDVQSILTHVEHGTSPLLTKTSVLKNLCKHWRSDPEKLAKM